MTTAQEVYDVTVRALPPTERLRLAALILQELTRSPAPSDVMGDEWSDEDTRNLTAHALGHAAATYPEDEGGPGESWAELGMERLESEWDNPQDAIYDDWRRLYGVERG